MKRLKAKIGWWKSRATYDWRPWKKRQLLQFYKGFIQAGDLCFDIGAHTGNRTATWEKLGAKIVAIEPQPLFYKFLVKRFKNKNVVVEQVGVGVETGALQLKISSFYPTVSTFSPKWESTVQNALGKEVYDEMIQVKITTLDHLIQQHGLPAFCKIDVEGYELEVLKGLNKAIPQISFEFYTTHLDLAEKCLARIAELGAYEFNWSRGEELKLKGKQWLGSSDLLESLKKDKEKGSFSGDIYARVKQ